MEAEISAEEETAQLETVELAEQVRSSTHPELSTTPFLSEPVHPQRSAGCGRRHLFQWNHHCVAVTLSRWEQVALAREELLAAVESEKEAREQVCANASAGQPDTSQVPMPLLLCTHSTSETCPRLTWRVRMGLQAWTAGEEDVRGSSSMESGDTSEDSSGGRSSCLCSSVVLSFCQSVCPFPLLQTDYVSVSCRHVVMSSWRGCAFAAWQGGRGSSDSTRASSRKFSTPRND